MHPQQLRLHPVLAGLQAADGPMCNTHIRIQILQPPLLKGPRDTKKRLLSQQNHYSDTNSLYRDSTL